MSEKKNIRFVVLGLLVIISMLLVSCGEEGSEQVSEQPTEQQPGEDQPTQEQPADQQPATGVDVVSTGFSPAENGFSYSNYGDGGITPGGHSCPVGTLTSVFIRPRFGDGACAAAGRGGTLSFT